MSEVLFRRKRCIARLQRSWLKDVVEECWRDLEVRGYTSECIQAYANIWLAFGEFMAKQGDCCLAHVHAWVNPFAVQRSTKKARIYVCRSIVRTLSTLLRISARGCRPAARTSAAKVRSYPRRSPRCLCPISQDESGA